MEFNQYVVFSFTSIIAISVFSRKKKIVEKGTNLAAADVNGKSDPYIIAELVRANKVNGKWTNIKCTTKTKTSTIQETLNPVWDFQVYSL